MTCPTEHHLSMPSFKPIQDGGEIDLGGVDKHHPYDGGQATICYRPDHL